MRPKAFGIALCTFMLFALQSGAAIAVDDGSLRGTVTDPLGATVSGANVQLLRDGTRIRGTSTDGRGEFSFEGLTEGRYRLEITAAGFETRRTDGTFVAAGTRARVDVGLQISPIEQSVVVTAAATAVSEAQIGAPVTVLARCTRTTKRWRCTRPRWRGPRRAPARSMPPRSSSTSATCRR